MEKPNRSWESEQRSLAEWVQALQDSDGETRWRAIDALRHLGHPSQTITLFLTALKDPYWRARALAAHALYDIAFEEEFVPMLSQAVTPLANALSDSSSDIRLEIARVLELLGPAARGALPQLQKALTHGNDEVRNAASAAISTISGIVPIRRFPV